MTQEINRLKSVHEKLVEYLNFKGVRVDSNAGTHISLSFKLSKNNLKFLKVACIMDEFSYLSYKPECDLMQLSVNNWEAEINGFAPDMLFIESAWQGKDQGWHRKIAHGSQELYELVRHCKEKGIPVVYWGKEDPVYTHVFITAASLADVIFTADLDSVAKYKAETGNTHVYHLHFAAQPQIHNPIEKFERKDMACFAGAYYHRYEQRSKVFNDYSDYFITHKGLDIYDRNFGNALPEHAFPKKYNPYILGKLDPEEIDRAYKGYSYNINMNSITQSQTMFARRVFELMASNTIVIGNFAQGVKNYFGELTICTDDVTSMQTQIEKYCGDSVSLRKYRLLALRQVLMEHLYQDRLSYVVEKVFGVNIKPALPMVAVVSDAATDDEKAFVRASFDKQAYENKVLYFLVDDNELPNGVEYIAYFADQDYYGKNYLLDLMLTTRYLDDSYEGICKATGNSSYTQVDTLDVRSGVLKAYKLDEVKISALLERGLLDGNFFSIDEFNYRRDYMDSSCEIADDISGIYSGIDISEINETAEAVQMPTVSSAAIDFSANDLCRFFDGAMQKRGLNAAIENGELKVQVNVAGEGSEYVYLNDYQPLDDVLAKGAFNCSLESMPSNCFGLSVIFYNKNKVQMSNKFINAGKSATFPNTDEAISNSTFFRVALRFKGSGDAIINGIKIGKPSFFNSGKQSLLKSDTLILSNIYPSYENLYRNMFVHARIKSYLQSGNVFDVMCSNIYAKDEYREFDGVQVMDGRSQRLSDVVSNPKIKTVCVHFLDVQMFTVLGPYLGRIRLIVWVHGSEIQPWWRRDYNYTTEVERNRAKELSDARMAFWRNVFAMSTTNDMHFVFVSQHFADEIMTDYNITIPANKYSIIHNSIDIDTFTYEEKDPEQRKRVFLCRPWTTRKYANDISVFSIQELAKHKEFNDMYFHISGTGELFKELTKPLRKYKNVFLEEKHYTHKEIAALHKQFGICLIPSRMDSQGVSRDEAMSSGLVPVTSAVAAIPEFVDDECGILAATEDYQALAQGILRLYHDSDLFMQMSKNAAERVRRQSATNIVIAKELHLIRGSK